jgi:F0F1-type ATP synthase membrane subunit b/b'
MNNHSDYFFYAALIFALLYWLFFKNSKEKFSDIKDVANTLRGVADDVDKAVDEVEKSEKIKKNKR